MVCTWSIWRTYIVMVNKSLLLFILIVQTFTYSAIHFHWTSSRPNCVFVMPNVINEVKLNRCSVHEEKKRGRFSTIHVCLFSFYGVLTGQTNSGQVTTNCKKRYKLGRVILEEAIHISDWSGTDEHKSERERRPPIQ